MDSNASVLRMAVLEAMGTHVSSPLPDEYAPYAKHREPTIMHAGNGMNVDQERLRSITSSIRTLVDPKRIILFGSHAHGVPDEASDVDLLVIDDSGRDKRTVSLEISRALFPRDYGLDLLVESSEDLEPKMGLQFWRDAVNSGTVLYERK